MPEPHPHTQDIGHAHDTGHVEDPGFDREIGYRRVIEFIVGLGVLTLVTMVLMGLLIQGFTNQVASFDPPPSPIPEANLPPASPGPQLQFFPPVADIQALHVWEDTMLEGYAWVDEERGMARIPVERAMDILARHGLPRMGAADSMSEELFGDRPQMPTEVQAGGADPEGGPP